MVTIGTKLSEAAKVIALVRWAKSRGIALAPSGPSAPEKPLPNLPDWTQKEKLLGEKEMQRLGTFGVSTISEPVQIKRGETAVIRAHGVTPEVMSRANERGLEVIEFACGIPTLLKGDFSDQVSTGVDVYSFRQPLGVCVGITPFNFPAMVPLWMFPLALATGNAFILKPSERDPSVPVRLAELMQEAGLPVTIYAKALPPDTTSNVAGGQISPFGHYREAEVTEAWRAQFRSAMDYSWRRFQIMVGDDYGVRWLPTYEEAGQPLGEQAGEDAAHPRVVAGEQMSALMEKGERGASAEDVRGADQNGIADPARDRDCASLSDAMGGSIAAEPWAE